MFCLSVVPLNQLTYAMITCPQMCSSWKEHHQDESWLAVHAQLTIHQKSNLKNWKFRTDFARNSKSRTDFGKVGTRWTQKLNVPCNGMHALSVK